MVVTVSIGVVVTAGTNAAPTALLRDADNARYDAKRVGRDQVIMYRTNARDVANLEWGLRPTRASQLSAG